MDCWVEESDIWGRMMKIGVLSVFGIGLVGSEESFVV